MNIPCFPRAFTRVAGTSISRENTPRNASFHGALAARGGS